MTGLVVDNIQVVVSAAPYRPRSEAETKISIPRLPDQFRIQPQGAKESPLAMHGVGITRLSPANVKLYGKE